MDTQHKTPSPVSTLVKGWAIGVTIGTVIGTTFGIALAKQYGANASLGPEGLITAFVIVGVLAGSYYGITVAYSGFRKRHHLGI